MIGEFPPAVGFPHHFGIPCRGFHMLRNSYGGSSVDFGSGWTCSYPDALSRISNRWKDPLSRNYFSTGVDIGILQRGRGPRSWGGLLRRIRRPSER